MCRNQKEASTSQQHPSNFINTERIDFGVYDGGKLLPGIERGCKLCDNFLVVTVRGVVSEARRNVQVTVVEI